MDEVCCSLMFVRSSTSKPSCLFDSDSTDEDSSKWVAQVPVLCTYWFLLPLSELYLTNRNLHLVWLLILHLFLTCGVRKPRPLSCPDFTEIKYARHSGKQDWKRENHAKLEPLRGRGHLAANHCDQIRLKSM